VTAHGSVDKAEPLIEAPVNTLEGNGPEYRVTTVSTMNIRSAKHCLRALLDYFWVRRMPVILTTTLLAGGKQTRTPILSPRLIQLLVLLLFLFPALSRARSVSQEKEREPLGSLTRVGEVYVNDSPAPAEITIFSGDRVRTGDSGSATFNMSGKGSLKISPRSQVLFSGKYEYTAELEAGAVALNSINGPNGLTLRIGSDVVVPSTKEQSASSTIDRAPDGSFLVSCSNGSVGVLTLKGTSGQFLQVGQSVSVSQNGELFPVDQVASATPGKSTSGARKARAGFSGWGYLGLAGAGAAVAAAAFAHGGGKQSVSPSSP